MTREEAIDILENEKMCVNNETCQREECATCSLVMDKDKILTALDMALSALRPVSREQVEKVWPGCEACKNAGLAIGEVQFYGPFEGSIDVSGNMQYCPNCGRPITPAAQEGQLERLEALEDAD